MDKRERFLRLFESDRRRVIGLMSGTSADGVDAVLLDIAGSGMQTHFELLATFSLPYSAEVQQAIFELFRPATGSVDRICHMNFVLGEIYARAALGVIQEAGLQPADVDLIGVWGQTTYYLPEAVQTADVTTGSVLQLCEPAVIAERTGITTVSNFLSRDIAAGGRGAPMASMGDNILYHDPVKNRVVQNIGGIANVGTVPASGDLESIIGFDTGPGNMIIDAVVKMITGGRQTYDRDGIIASSGQVNQPLLDSLMADPYLHQAPPKSTGREQYGEQYSASLLARARAGGVSDPDLVATVTAFTAESIAFSYRRFVFPHLHVDEVIVGGGGAKNPHLLRLLGERLAPIPVVTDKEYGVPPEYREPLHIALAANETISFHAGNVPAVTGARKWVVLGAITPA